MSPSEYRQPLINMSESTLRVMPAGITWTCARCRQPAREHGVLFCVDVDCYADMHSFTVRCECGQRVRFGVRGHQALSEAFSRGGSVELIELTGLPPEVH